MRIYLDTCIISRLKELYALQGKWVFNNSRLTQDVIAMKMLIQIHDKNPNILEFCVSDDSHHEIEKMKEDTPRKLLAKNQVKAIFHIFETSQIVKLGHSIKWGEGYRWGSGAVWAGKDTDDLKNNIEKDLMKWSGSKKNGKFHDDARHLANILLSKNKIDIFLTVDYKLLSFKDNLMDMYKITIKSPMELIKTLA